MDGELSLAICVLKNRVQLIPDTEVAGWETDMERHRVTFFRPYPLEAEHKIHIEGGPRRGDWEVVGVTERTMRLRCPISGKEVEWERFCYFVETRDNEEWPRED